MINSVFLFNFKSEDSPINYTLNIHKLNKALTSFQSTNRIPYTYEN